MRTKIFYIIAFSTIFISSIAAFNNSAYAIPIKAENQIEYSEKKDRKLPPDYGNDVPIYAESVKTFDNSISVRTSYKIHFLDLYIGRDNFEKHNDDVVSYIANYTGSLMVSASYENIGISYTFDLHHIDDTERYGKTKLDSFQFYYYGQNLGIEFNYLRFRGYYLFDIDRYQISPDDPEAVRSDLEIRSIGGNIFYIFSDDYSYSAGFTQTTRQINNAWSLMVMLSFDHTTIKSDYTLVPLLRQGVFGSFGQYHGGRYISIGIAPGLGATFLLGKIFFSPAIFVGIGYMNSRHDIYENQTILNSAEWFLNLRTAVGYNGDHFFIGATISMQFLPSSSLLENKDNSYYVLISTGYFEFFAGIRI